MRVFTVIEPVFKTEPLFVLDCSHEAFARFMKRHHKLDAGLDIGQLGQMFTFSDPTFRVIWTKRLDAPAVLHEVFHLVTRICHDRGVSIRARTGDGELGDETAAYLFEFFAKAVLRRLR